MISIVLQVHRRVEEDETSPSNADHDTDPLVHAIEVCCNEWITYKVHIQMINDLSHNATSVVQSTASAPDYAFDVEREVKMQ